MAPIPRRLLAQTAQVHLPKEGGYGGEYEKAQQIEHVRFEAAASISQADYQLQAPMRGTLFIDAVNSCPAMELPAGTLVNVDGEVSGAVVHECRPMRDGLGRIHHWEVELR